MPENTSKTPNKHSVSAATRPSDELMAQLRQFIRTRGGDYLKDPNITSIGIGRKEVDPKSPRKHLEGELCIQFTVGKKVRNDNVVEIESLNSKPIPKQIQVNGGNIPTDVIERNYKPGFHVVAEPVPSQERKVRRNPIQPGISIGHPTITAGTLGAIVYDLRDGSPCMLSNWHVLQGTKGKAGDAVLQPGSYDDPNAAMNRAGVLVRSHLGQAGDCAIARIDGRGFDREIVDLGVSIAQIGEPELDDIVIKSGRTTNVTYGKVRRVDTIAKINYGEGGEDRIEAIGCFEIGVDPANPPADGEVSMGGDSGAAWLAVNANGKPTDVMVGLHFGGEAYGSNDEHALACYPKSVFSKLEISLTRPADSAVAVTGELQGTGFDQGFLSKPVALPRLRQDAQADVFELNNSPHIPYTHFSVCLSKSRRMARFVAWNIDGSSLKAYSRNGLSFKFDERVPKYCQIGNEAYKENKVDRGHIARRADVVWGAAAEAQAANRESFYFTNITPQHQRFNQSERHGLWGLLENAIYEDVDVENLRVSVMGGPILKDDDMKYRGIKVPDEFWKVIAYVEKGILKAQAYVLSQADYLNDIEALELDEFRLWQVTLADLAERARLDFGDLAQADTLQIESLRRPEMAGPSGRVARELLSRDDLFSR
jgi:endonuclease G